MDYFNILLLVLFSNFRQSCCLLQIFCCNILKMLHPWLFTSKLGLKMFPDLGEVKKNPEAGKCIHVMFRKVINPSWNEK